MVKKIRYLVTWLLLISSTIIGIVCIFLEGDIETIDVGVLSLSIPFIICFSLVVINIIFNVVWHFVLKRKKLKLNDNIED